jgi:hypothetical protein
MVTLSKPQTSGAKSDGRFGKRDFAYLPQEDVYRCRAGEQLPHRFTSEEDGKRLRRYWTTAVKIFHLNRSARLGQSGGFPDGSMSILPKAEQQRLDAKPQAMRQRRETVGHDEGPHGTTHFVTKNAFKKPLKWHSRSWLII